MGQLPWQPRRSLIHNYGYTTEKNIGFILYRRILSLATGQLFRRQCMLVPPYSAQRVPLVETLRIGLEGEMTGRQDDGNGKRQD